MSYKIHPNRGILKFTMDGTQVGGTLDQYSATVAYPETTFGNVTFATTGNHIVRLTVTGKNASAGAYTLSSDKFTLVSVASAINLTDTDIGGPGVAGSGSVNGTTYTVSGSGTDIWGTSDKLNYYYQNDTGDLTFTARVASVQNTNAWAKVGLMVRESTAANAAYVGIYVTPGNGVSMQYRSATGVTATDLARNTGFVAPYWVRLVRSGNTFTGFRSPDGVTWTQVGQISVTMAANVTEGFAVCSHNNTTLNTSTFDNVSVQ